MNKPKLCQGCAHLQRRWLMGQTWCNIDERPRDERALACALGQARDEMRRWDKLEALRQVLEAKKVTKVYPAGTVANTFVREPDPAYASLLAVVREQCPLRSQLSLEDWRLQHLDSAYGGGCPCRGTGWRTRNWDSLPKGALAGALMLACGEAGVSFSLNIWEADTPDETALDAVLAALEMKP